MEFTSNDLRHRRRFGASLHSEQLFECGRENYWREARHCPGRVHVAHHSAWPNAQVPCALAFHFQRHARSPVHRPFSERRGTAYRGCGAGPGSVKSLPLSACDNGRGEGNREALAMKLDTVRPTAAHPYYSIPCAQCGDALIAPQWSEHVSARCVRHVWSCEGCGYQFESL